MFCHKWHRQKVRPYKTKCYMLPRINQQRTNIRIYSDIRILFSEYPIFKYKYWVFTNWIYSSIGFLILIFLNIFEYLIRIFPNAKYIRISDDKMLKFKYLFHEYMKSKWFGDIIYIDSVSSQSTGQGAWWPGAWEDISDNNLNWFQPHPHQ